MKYLLLVYATGTNKLNDYNAHMANIIGPFDSEIDAETYAEEKLDIDKYWVILNLQSPAKD